MTVPFSAVNPHYHPAPFDTAVLFLVFNRPDTTRQVFEAIRQARPPRFYIAADGPRSGRPGEGELCDTVRAVAAQIDWPCEVKTLFRDENLGCKMAVNSALDWFFSQEEQGIVLEDDCLPGLSFFGFCQELLDRYKNDERVWQICGTAFVAEAMPLERSDSYLFSKYGPVWGWASWRRAWVKNDPNMRSWQEMKKDHWLRSAYPETNERSARALLGEKLYKNEIDTWDYQWGFAKNFQSGLSVIPARNMVVNLGFGPQATHTTSRNARAPKKIWEVRFPLVHPPFVMADIIHDDYYRGYIGIGAKTKLVVRIFNRVVSMTKYFLK